MVGDEFGMQEYVAVNLHDVVSLGLCDGFVAYSREPETFVFCQTCTTGNGTWRLNRSITSGVESVEPSSAMMTS